MNNTLDGPTKLENQQRATPLGKKYSESTFGECIVDLSEVTFN